MKKLYSSLLVRFIQCEGQMSAQAHILHTISSISSSSFVATHGEQFLYFFAIVVRLRIYVRTGFVLMEQKFIVWCG